MKVFKCEEVKFEIATSAWEKAKHCSLFCSPVLLDALGYKVRYLGGYKNNDLLIIWPLVETEHGFSSPPHFSYYFGPFWVNSYLYDAPYKIFKNNLEVLNSMMPLVETLANKVSFSLVPEFPDLRPFLWWNYHDSNRSKFEINLKYTGRIRFKNQLSKNDLYLQFRADDKRKKIKKTLSEGYLTTRWGISKQAHEYANLYETTLERTKGYLNDTERKILIKMVSLANNDSYRSVNFKMIELIDTSNGSVEGFQLILVGKEKIYMISQSVSTKGMMKNGNVLLTFEVIRFANDNKFNLDFNGANSPNRADDKHAFGADITNYYDLRLI
jgi:hypothetical protein